MRHIDNSRHGTIVIICKIFRIYIWMSHNYIFIFENVYYSIIHWETIILFIARHLLSCRQS